MIQKTKLLMGKPLAEALLARVADVLPSLPRVPSVCLVRVGHNPASVVYMQKKMEVFDKLKIPCDLIVLNENDGELALHGVLRALAHDIMTTGIVLQLPLPAGWGVQEALDMIPALKDVDGLSTDNKRQRLLWPATPLGVMRLLDSVGVSIEGKQVCVVGTSDLVGKPLDELFKKKGGNVRMVDKETPHPARFAAEADILCVATGVPGLVVADWVKEGAVVVDIGITRVDGKLVGDVAPDAADKARLITPVPGGVGPLTVASLATNCVDALCLQEKYPLPDWSF